MIIDLQRISRLAGTREGYFSTRGLAAVVSEFFGVELTAEEGQTVVDMGLPTEERKRRRSREVYWEWERFHDQPPHPPSTHDGIDSIELIVDNLVGMGSDARRRREQRHLRVEELGRQPLVPDPPFPGRKILSRPGIAVSIWFHLARSVQRDPEHPLMTERPTVSDAVLKDLVQQITRYMKKSGLKNVYEFIASGSRQHSTTQIRLAYAPE